MKTTRIDDHVEADDWIVRHDVGLDQFKGYTRIVSPPPGMLQRGGNKINTDNREPALCEVDRMCTGSATNVQRAAAIAPFSRNAEQGGRVTVPGKQLGSLNATIHRSKYLLA